MHMLYVKIKVVDFSPTETFYVYSFITFKPFFYEKLKHGISLINQTDMKIVE